MKWIAEIKTPRPMNFIIEQAKFKNHTEQTEFPGYYLYVYEDGNELYDYLQNSQDMAKLFALKKFQVPLDAWIQVE